MPTVYERSFARCPCSGLEYKGGKLTLPLTNTNPEHGKCYGEQGAKDLSARLCYSPVAEYHWIIVR
jgi:hypothetical protein